MDMSRQLRLFMQTKHHFVARIFIDRDDEEIFAGTGFLVASSYLLTCAHVLLDVDLEDWNEWVRENAGPLRREVRVIFGETTERNGTVVAYDEQDLGLICLDWPIALEPLPLVSGLRSMHADALKAMKGAVVGFSRTRANKLAETRIDQFVSLTADYQTQHLLNLQVVGGLRSGMSGAPLIANVGGQCACFGMTYLGGESSATSRLVLSGVLLDFLARHHVPFVPPIEAANYFSSTLGGLIQRQRLKRNRSRRELAADVRISEETLNEWESDRNRPAAAYRTLLYEEIIRGDPGAVEEWQRLADTGDSAASTDPVARLRPLANSRAISVKPIKKYRMIGRLAPSSRPRFEIGCEVKIIVTLPWAGNVTFLNVAGLESIPRSFYCLDPVLGVSGSLPAGEINLPIQKDSLPVGAPPALHCLLVLARKTGKFAWTRRGAQEADNIPETEIRAAIQDFTRLPPDQIFVGIFEYEVITS
jgi:transcriptional regulator with XRE-family HTH domain